VLPRLQILAAALLFSTAGAAIKALSLTSWQVASFRSGIAAIVVLALLPGARAGLTTRASWVGASFAGTMILFVTATRMTTAANAIFLQATAPLYVLVLAPWLLGEPIRRRDVLFMGMLAVGLSLFFVGVEAPTATAPNPLRGNILAASSGVCWAFTVIGIRWLGHPCRAAPGATLEAPGSGPSQESVSAAVVLGNLFAFLACLPWALPVADATSSDWLILAYLGTFQVGLAYVSLTRGMAQVSAFETSLLLLMENALNPVWVWLLHGEIPGTLSIAGGAIILVGTAVKAWIDAPVRRASHKWPELS
jgi:drug/metabolite transporter (DMT)-like permease